RSPPAPRPLKGTLVAFRLQVHSRGFAAAVHFELELQPIAFVERRDPGALHGGNVHERVGLSVIALDEAKALHRVEELDGSACFLAGQLALWSAIATTAAAATTAASALDRHRFAFDPKV